MSVPACDRTRALLTGCRASSTTPNPLTPQSSVPGRAHPQPTREETGRMTPLKPLCEQYEHGRRSPFGNGLTLGRYLAAVKADTLPSEVNRDEHIVRHGYAVGFVEWMFFPAIEPAGAFGRAAR